MTYKCTNNANSVLAANMAASAGATTLEIDPADVALFPVVNNGGVGSDYSRLTLFNASLDHEIVRVTRHDTASAVFTVVRGEENTTIRAWNIGDGVSLRPTAQLVLDAFLHIEDTSAAHAASAISFAPTGTIAATDVQAAIAEASGDMTTHASANPAHAASNISFTPAGDIAATNAQAAIAELDTEAGKLAKAQTWTKAQRGDVYTLTDGATITPDFSLGNNFTVTLGGNRNLANPTNIVAGQSGVIVVKQDGTGSRTLTYGGYWDFGGVTPTLQTAANSIDYLAYYVESATRIRVAMSAVPIAPGTAGNVLTSNGTQWVSQAHQYLGVDQSWQNMTASRANNTVYQNTTGRPIEVKIVGNASLDSYMYLYVGSASPPTVVVDQDYTSSYVPNTQLSAIIPVGNYYKTTGMSVLANWAELR